MVTPHDCLTCSDVAVEARVLAVVGDTAVVEVEGHREHVAVELVAPVAAGEILLCHAGIAIRVLARPRSAITSAAAARIWGRLT